MSAFENLFTTVADRVKKLGADLTLQLKRLTIGEADEDTGIFSLSYSEPEDIEGVLVTRGAQLALAGTGLIVTHDALLITRVECAVGDLILDAEGNVYRVASVAAEMVGDQLVYYSVNLMRVITG